MLGYDAKCDTGFHEERCVRVAKAIGSDFSYSRFGTRNLE